MEKVAADRNAAGAPYLWGSVSLGGVSGHRASSGPSVDYADLGADDAPLRAADSVSGESVAHADGDSGSSRCQTVEDAEAAYARGDYETALRLWRQLADQGNAQAQNKLGEMYLDGSISSLQG